MEFDDKMMFNNETKELEQERKKVSEKKVKN
jgi:hypothetical protein